MLVSMLACVWSLLSIGPIHDGGHTLSGTVRGSDGPLAGATVFVSTARPRRGVGVL